LARPIAMSKSGISLVSSAGCHKCHPVTSARWNRNSEAPASIKKKAITSKTLPQNLSSNAGSRRKGGDGGVDGFLYIKPDGKKTEKVIVSVKGGQSLNPAMVKDLIVIVDQEGAKMGVFLTLEPPTKGMKTQAAAAGFYKTEYGQFPKIQIVTVGTFWARKSAAFALAGHVGVQKSQAGDNGKAIGTGLVSRRIPPPAILFGPQGRATAISARIASAAARGSGALVTGLPMTR
jgi:Restriction endonuclease